MQFIDAFSTVTLVPSSDPLKVGRFQRHDYFSKHGIINPIPEIFNRMWKKNRNPGGASIFHFNGSKPWIDRSSIDKNTFDLWSYFYEYDNN